jgi:hypothetical protein
MPLPIPVTFAANDFIMELGTRGKIDLASTGSEVAAMVVGHTCFSIVIGSIVICALGRR